MNPMVLITSEIVITSENEEKREMREEKEKYQNVFEIIKGEQVN